MVRAQNSEARAQNSEVLAWPPAGYLILDKLLNVSDLTIEWRRQSWNLHHGLVMDSVLAQYLAQGGAPGQLFPVIFMPLLPVAHTLKSS